METSSSLALRLFEMLEDGLSELIVEPTYEDGIEGG